MSTRASLGRFQQQGFPEAVRHSAMHGEYGHAAFGVCRDGFPGLHKAAFSPSGRCSPTGLAPVTIASAPLARRKHMGCARNAIHCSWPFGVGVGHSTPGSGQGCIGYHFVGRCKSLPNLRFMARLCGWPPSAGNSAKLPRPAFAQRSSLATPPVAAVLTDC